MTHKDLVKIAERYLYKTKRCGFVFTDFSTAAFERPDAIGFTSSESYLIECKMSRGDFRNDFKKMRLQNPDGAMGNYRFYLCPEGLIKKEELPEHYGLIYVTDNMDIRTIRGADYYNDKFKRSHSEELKMMYSALRRLKKRGVFELIYDKIDTKLKIISK